MHSLQPRILTAARVLLVFLMCHHLPTTGRSQATNEQEQHDQLVARLRALAGVEGAWGPAYQPLYHAALPWYEQWGGTPRHPVDDWMSPPEEYATKLADALEHGRNFFAENPGALLPLAFEGPTPNGRTIRANYWIRLPAGFPQTGRTFPLVISLHGSGWLGHKISFVGRPRKGAPAGPAFVVTPINEGGPWQLDLLNTYLDALLRMFPIDADHVYVQGHSLGAMATWEWALHNPERFAAISPRSGQGEPFRAARLKQVPSWVIHGADDDDVLTGFSDQMVSALQACGASVRYSILPGVGHNMPDDLDEGQVVDWYLRQTRSHQPAPADPRDHLGVTDAGFSPWEIITVEEASFWKSDPVPVADRDACVRAAQFLFQKARALGELADSPILQKLDPKTGLASFWLAIPKTLRSGGGTDPAAIIVPSARYARFYFRGETQKALAHFAAVTAEVQASGQRVADEWWVTPLALRPDTATHLAEYRVEVK